MVETVPLWDKLRQRALEINLRRAKSKARGQINKDFDINHPNEVRDATKESPDYTLLTKRVKTNLERKQAAYKNLMEKLKG